MSTLRVSWRAAETLQREQFVATGKIALAVQSTEFDLAQLTPAERAIVFEAWTQTSGDSIDIDLRSRRTPRTPQQPDTAYTSYYNTEELTFAAPPTLAEILAYAQANTATLTAAKAAADQVARERQAALAAKAATEAQAERERSAVMTPLYRQIEAAAEAAIAGDSLEAIAAVYASWPQGLGYNFHPTGGESLDHRLSERRKTLKVAAERAEKAAWVAEQTLKVAAERAEKAAWVAEHGSDYLKRATAAGHDCSRLYWIERAALAYPGYVLDYEKHHDSKSRACPSLRALDERDAILAAHPGVKVNIEWLTDAPLSHKRAEWEPFEECEGVVVDDDAYDHYLVKLL